MDTTNESATVEPQVVYVEKKSNGLATGALVMGILAIVFSFIPFLNVITLPMALIALGLGIPGLIKARKLEIGKVKSVIAIALALGSFFMFYSVNNATVNAVNDAVEEFETAVSAKDNVDVTLGKAAKDSLGYTELPVTIANTSEETVSVWVTIAATSADGSEQYDTTSVIVSDLGAGQTAKEDASFVEDIPSDAEFVITDIM